MQAVITGDIINSTKLTNGDRLNLIKNIQKEFKHWSPTYNFRSEFFRGDSFQCFFFRPQDSLRIALLVKTYIRSLYPPPSFSLSGKSRTSAMLPFITDARIAIGIGEAQAGKKLSTSGGEAFTLSGRQLDELKNKKQTFAIATDDIFGDELRTEAILLDAIISKTTSLQCQVINLKLQNHNENDISRQLKINQSAVNQRSTSGNWNAITVMVNRFETIYSK